MSDVNIVLILHWNKKISSDIVSKIWRTQQSANHPHNLPNPQTQHPPHRPHASNDPCLSKGRRHWRCSQMICAPPKDSARGGVQAAPGGAQPLSPRSCEGAWRKPHPTHQVDSQAACAKGEAWQTTKSANKGPVSQLDPLKEELLAWIFACREQGIVVTKAQFVFKASVELHSFGAKTFKARFKVVSRLLGQHGYIYCMRTKEDMRPPHKVYAQALDFLTTTRLLLVGPHYNKGYIWNMDQMPLWFLYHCLKTLAKQGAKTIHVRKTSSDTKRATAALADLAAGEWLKPMVIFKGRPRGKISRKELKTVDHLAFYAYQKAEWMDETCMIHWVRLVVNDYLWVNHPRRGSFRF